MESGAKRPSTAAPAGEALHDTPGSAASSSGANMSSAGGSKGGDDADLDTMDLQGDVLRPWVEKAAQKFHDQARYVVDPGSAASVSDAIQGTAVQKVHQEL